MKRLLLVLIRLYQLLLSPLLGNVCRFEPSCSRYAAACLENHGALRGSWLALKRIGRCHPFHPGGFDPPPPNDPRPATRSPALSSSRAATSSPALSESACHTECRAHGCSR